MKQLRAELSEQEFSMWFNRMEYSHSRESEIVVSVPSSFYRDQVRQRYLPMIEGKLHELCGTALTLDFEVKTVSRAENSRSTGPAGGGASASPQASPRNGEQSRVSTSVSSSTSSTTAVKTPSKKAPHDNLREEYTFENFVIGQNNSFAANAAMAIARNPGTGYNPCLIYGGVGLGKTHLIQSIG
ncbi:MAG: DnaA/Hda family protein, partial [Spirochaetia bacterium]